MTEVEQKFVDVLYDRVSEVIEQEGGNSDEKLVAALRALIVETVHGVQK